MQHLNESSHWFVAVVCGRFKYGIVPILAPIQREKNGF